jgi:hypothetical protein
MLFEASEVRRPVGMSSCKCGNHVKMDLKCIGCD